MAKQSKPQPPTKQRYDRNHPAIAIRVPKELKDDLLALREKSGLGFADILKVGADLSEVQVGESHEKGFAAGYAWGKQCYCVAFPCTTCGRSIEISGDESKRAVAEMMVAAEWKHKSCPEAERS